MHGVSAVPSAYSFGRLKEEVEILLVTTRNKKLLGTSASLLVTSALLVVTKKLLGAKGLTTRNKKLLAFCFY